MVSAATAGRGGATCGGDLSRERLAVAAVAAAAVDVGGGGTPAPIGHTTALADVRDTVSGVGDDRPRGHPEDDGEDQESENGVDHDCSSHDRFLPVNRPR